MKNKAYYLTSDTIEIAVEKLLKQLIDLISTFEERWQNPSLSNMQSQGLSPEILHF